ncbi:MAG: DUF1573 domain-containing protein [Armatimonadota bacterium]|nr:DUF1573 domain-containing protein [Armatimonadota bacterium]
MSRKKRRGKAHRASRRDRRSDRPLPRIRVLVVPALVLVLAAGGYLIFRWLGPGASSAGAPASGVTSPVAGPRVSVPEGAPAAGPAVPASGGALPAPPSGVPSLRVTPSVYNLGQVSQAAGRVTVRLAVSNTGTADLVITEMETSCGCTRAALVVDGRSGPWFGMRGHGTWPAGWSARLRPGQQAALLVEYDPNAHGIYRGPIDRAVLIHSNDPRQPHAEVRLTGAQVP